MIALGLFSPQICIVTASICIRLYEKEGHSGYHRWKYLIIGVHVGKWGQGYKGPQKKSHCALQTQYEAKDVLDQGSSANLMVCHSHDPGQWPASGLAAIGSGARLTCLWGESSHRKMWMPKWPVMWADSMSWAEWVGGAKNDSGLQHNHQSPYAIICVFTLQIKKRCKETPNNSKIQNKHKV